MWKLKAVSRIDFSYLNVKQTLQEIKCHQIYHFTSFHSQIIDVKKPFEILTWQYSLGLPLPTSRITLLFRSLVSQLFTPPNVHAQPSNVWPCANCSLILRAWLSDGWGALVKRSECQKAQRTKSIGSKGHLILETGLWRALGLLVYDNISLKN